MCKLWTFPRSPLKLLNRYRSPLTTAVHIRIAEIETWPRSLDARTDEISGRFRDEMRTEWKSVKRNLGNRPHVWRSLPDDFESLNQLLVEQSWVLVFGQSFDLDLVRRRSVMHAGEWTIKSWFDFNSKSKWEISNTNFMELCMKLSGG